MIHSPPSQANPVGNGVFSSPWLNWFSELGNQLEGLWGNEKKNPVTSGISGEITQKIINLGKDAYIYNLSVDSSSLSDAEVALPYNVLETVVQVYNGTTLLETIAVQGNSFNLTDQSGVNLRIRSVFIRS